MYTSKIIEAKVDSLANGFEFMSVEFSILKDEKEVARRKLSFGVDIDEQSIKKIIKKHVDLHEVESKLAVEDAKKHARNKKALETIKKLKGEKHS